MEKNHQRITYVLSIAVIIVSIATIFTMYEIQALSEKETHPNLIISSVSQETPRSNSSNGILDILTIKPTIEVYNTKRSDYPARILLVKSRIFDDKTGQVIVENKHLPMTGAENTVIDSGENIKFSTKIQMNQNKTGNYTTQITIEYVDLKDSTLQSIDFYNEFEVTEKLFENKIIIYSAQLKEVGDFNELWAIGKKYD